MTSVDRRKSQRLELSKPILATIGSANALILDIGIGGAFVEHYGVAAPGERLNLLFRWQGNDVELVCEVARSSVVKEPAGDRASVVSQTGLRFLEAVGESSGHLRNLMETFVRHVFEAQRANASGFEGQSAGADVLARLGDARRMRSRGFIAYELAGDVWQRTQTDSPQQPEDGFTVSDHEEEDDIERLCRAYEDADGEGRHLIRVFAELSLNKA